jgi:NADPH:quinone reductase
MKAIVAKQLGSPDVLELKDVPKPTPKEGQIVMQLKFCGVNMVDTIERRGLFQDVPRVTPYIPGLEGSGLVAAVGPGVKGFKIGDRVGFMQFMGGAYAEYAFSSDKLAFKLPDDIPFEVAASMTVRGLTAHYLIHEYVTLRPGIYVVIHSAAGGMGLMLTHWAKHHGAFVIGTTSSPNKAATARENGCDKVIVYTQEDFPAAVMEITNGHGADLILDAVGKDTIPLDLRCINNRGTIVFYGMASGKPEPIDPYFLYYGRSIRFAGGDCYNYLQTPEEMQMRLDAVFDGYRKGYLKPDIAEIVPLERAAEVHRKLESRATSGKFLLQIS